MKLGLRDHFALAGASLLTALCLAVPVEACSAKEDLLDDRILVSPDGSFESANIARGDIMQTYPADPVLDYDQRWDIANGGPVLYRGKGRFVQRIDFSAYGCSGQETLLFVDCNSAQSLLLFGGQDPELDRFEGYSWSSIRVIQPPFGPISVTGDTTLESLTAAARKGNVSYIVDAEVVFADVQTRDRYNLFNGCKMFYPDSLGAKR
jgi:hypothetical protein